MGYIYKAVSWAAQIANDDSYKYVWGITLFAEQKAAARVFGKAENCNRTSLTAVGIAGISLSQHTPTRDLT